jgi:hypothetical protein
MQTHRARRRFLKNMAFATAAMTTPGLFAEELTRTASQGEGPFYPDELPLDTDNDLIRAIPHKLNRQLLFPVHQTNPLRWPAAAHPLRRLSRWQTPADDTALRKRQPIKRKRFLV